MKQHNYNRENPPNKYNPLAVITESVDIGDNCWIGPFVMIQGNVTIDREVSLSSGVKVFDHDTSEYRVTEGKRKETHYEVHIGKFTQIGSNTVIVPHGKDINIGDHVIIGAQCVICNDVGHHSKVGPLSYVKFPIKPWTHAAGAPAKTHKDMNPDFYKGVKKDD